THACKAVLLHKNPDRGRSQTCNDRQKVFPDLRNSSEPIHGTRTLQKNRRSAARWCGAFRTYPFFAYRPGISDRRFASRGCNHRLRKVRGAGLGAKVAASESDCGSFDPITPCLNAEIAGAHPVPRSTRGCEPFHGVVPAPPAFG